MLKLLGQIGVETATTAPASAPDLAPLWLPSSAELLRGLGVAGGILIAGLTAFAVLRPQIVRTRLATAFLVLLATLAIYFGIAAARGTHWHDKGDPLTLWLTRLFNACLLFVGLCVANRLILVPVLTRGGRLPLPRFVQQIILIVAAIFATLGYGSYTFGWDINKFLAGSAVVSIVLGLALQETLGNFFSGLVMQASSPFAHGDWITCAGVEGRVVDLTWRAVTLHTADDNFVHIPNAMIAKEQIINFNTPTTATARSIKIGLEYAVPPLEAIAVLKAAALETAGVSAAPAPYIFVHDYGDSAIIYRIKFWITDPPSYPKLEHMVRLNAWYRLRQKGLTIPFPIRTVEHVSLEKKQRREADAVATERLKAIESAGLLAALSPEEKRTLAEAAGDVMLAPHQVLFRQDDPGESFYIIRHGTADVLIRDDSGDKVEKKLATLGPGDYFGEMSALTGQPRTATLRAATPLVCVEIRKEELHALFDKNPAIMEQVSLLIARRNAERQAALEDAGAQAHVAEQQKSVFGRMLSFFGFKGR